MLLLRLLRPPPAVAAAVLLSAAACGGSPTSPSTYAPYSQTDLRLGPGATATNGSVVTVHYTAWLFNGSQPDQKGVQFESSAGLTPFTFTLGVGQVIRGWDQGLPGMKVGGLRRLVIPPSLAYGETRNGIVPPSATLIFEVELLEVQ